MTYFYTTVDEKILNSHKKAFYLFYQKEPHYNLSVYFYSLPEANRCW